MRFFGVADDDPYVVFQAGGVKIVEQKMFNPWKMRMNKPKPLILARFLFSAILLLVVHFLNV
jgi:hypothetical protein